MHVFLPFSLHGDIQYVVAHLYVCVSACVFVCQSSAFACLQESKSAFVCLRCFDESVSL